ncbi:class I adenylate-forming enzyme family protein [Mycobacterium sp. URHB0044]|uniref:class I adenylate-forming enzyme family protein n=1 Tax=Mycobacterium sp. URHB0044 TaxID=1380386 RepID=UPI00048B70EE|nr:AMP-binding protein [Mycobacterium sp. URHB0044]
MLIGELLADAATNWPDRAAVIAGDVHWTFAELNARMLRLAGALSELADTGDRVAILARNVPEYVEALYAVPSAGMILTLLNYRLHPREWVDIMNAVDARVLLVDPELLESIRPFLDDVAALDHVLVIGNADDQDRSLDAAIAAAGAFDAPIEVSDDTPAWLVYTSGTTGFPKGAQITHRGIIAAAAGTMLSVHPRDVDRYLMTFPLCHVSAFQVPTYHACGVPITLMPTFEAGAFLKTIDQQRITLTSLAPTMAAFVLDHPDLDQHDLSSLRSVGYGGMPMPPTVARALIDRLGPVLVTGFGQTESTGWVTALSPDDHVRALSGEERLLTSCGRALPFIGLRVVDDAMRDTAPGEPGELIIRGDLTFGGYWNDPESTAAAYAGGWLHTGDVVTKDDEGFVFLVDRKKDMIVSGGQNVYSTQVELVLQRHPAVAEVAVIGLPDPLWGETVTAVVVPHAGMTIDGSELISACGEELARFKVPRHVFVAEALPKTVTGKVLKRELRTRYALELSSAP